MDVALDLGYDQKMLQGGPPTQEIKAEIQQDYSRIDLFFQTLNVQYTLQKPSVPVSIKIPNFGKKNFKFFYYI